MLKELERCRYFKNVGNVKTSLEERMKEQYKNKKRHLLELRPVLFISEWLDTIIIDAGI